MTAHPFTIHNYRAYWIARFASTLASLSMVVVIGWQVYDIARQTMGVQQAALQLGLVGLAQFLPLLILSLVAGWVADRIDRRWIIRAAILLEVVCASLLAWLTASDAITLPALFGIAALLGVGRAFAGPALSALAPNLVPKDALPTAIALSALAWQVGSIGGPALGGYLYAADRALPYQVSAAMFVLSLTMMLLVTRVPRANMKSGANPFAQMADGLRYVKQNRLVLGAISLDMFAVLLGGATAMLPIYARDILHIGADGLGHLRAAPAVGAVAVALVLSWRPLKTNVGTKMLWSVVGFGLATAVFGWAGPVMTAWWGPAMVGSDTAPAVLVSLVALAALGAFDMISVYVRGSLIQLYTPDAMRGRVGAVSTLFISSSNELGEARAGFLAAAIGPVIATAGGGVLAVLVTALWARIFPELQRARTFDPPVELVEPMPEETKT
ncbi:MFS transporter [Sphingomonas turrisvirgatae]|uniref:MFS transporter n=1 Tax=Sphingomonas turrisvirgatae TaxID=1888892 RepID=A0A1E3M025_9SPHN|nr:MFS transporter [Sphingomonas turrisvirgatae]ODP39339.1 MFS transporter [Sphingomonas turrisvirgatae]